MKKGKIVYTTNKKLAFAVKEFQELLEKANEEHGKTFAAQVEEQLEEQGLDATDELVDSVRENVSETINERISELGDEILNDPGISENLKEEIKKLLLQDIREAFGIMDLKGSTIDERIEYLEIQAEHWRDFAKIETARGTEESLKEAMAHATLANICDLKADDLRLRTNQRVQSQEGMSIQQEETENNDLTRLKKIKDWPKENLGTLSAVVVSVAGVITTIVMGFKKGVVRGARATGKFAKTIAKIAAKAGPVIGAVLNLIGTVLGLGAKGILWLFQNLWILAVFITYWLYDQYKRRSRK